MTTYYPPKDPIDPLDYSGRTMTEQCKLCGVPIRASAYTPKRWTDTGKWLVCDHKVKDSPFHTPIRCPDPLAICSGCDMYNINCECT